MQRISIPSIRYKWNNTDADPKEVEGLQQLCALLQTHLCGRIYGPHFAFLNLRCCKLKVQLNVNEDDVTLDIGDNDAAIRAEYMGVYFRNMFPPQSIKCILTDVIVVLPDTMPISNNSAPLYKLQLNVAMQPLDLVLWKCMRIDEKRYNQLFVAYKFFVKNGEGIPKQLLNLSSIFIPYLAFESMKVGEIEKAVTRTLKLRNVADMEYSFMWSRLICIPEIRKVNSESATRRQARWDTYYQLYLMKQEEGKQDEEK